MSRNYFKPTHLSLWNFVKTKNRPTKGATKNKEWNLIDKEGVSIDMTFACVDATLRRAIQLDSTQNCWSMKSLKIK